MCGFYDEEGNTHKTNCQGVDISTGNCPSGYSYKLIGEISGGDIYSCIKD